MHRIFFKIVVWIHPSISVLALQIKILELLFDKL